MHIMSTKWGPVAISLLVVITFGIVLFLLLTRVIANADSSLMTMVIGGLAAKFHDVVSFWLGSSAGSKAKDDIVSLANQRIVR